MINGKKADDGYKRKKLRISNTRLNSNSIQGSTEMEIEAVEGTLEMNLTFIRHDKRVRVMKNGFDFY